MTFRVTDLMAAISQGQGEDERDDAVSCRTQIDSCGQCSGGCPQSSNKPEQPPEPKAISLGLLRSAMQLALAQG